MIRKKFIAGNWKMNGTVQEASILVKGILERKGQFEGVEAAVCPPFIVLPLVASLLKGSPIQVGAQNAHWEAKGAYTGEVSLVMLKEAGCRYVIVGHSERRTLFGEIDETVNKKAISVLREGLFPIMCVGETLAEREKGLARSVVERQISKGLEGIPSKDVERITIAYEPVWAIGTGKVATPDQAVEVHRWIRDQLSSLYGVEVAERVRIQYGGSVTPENCESLLSRPEIDGALVGGASLKVEGFVKIMEVARACTRS